VNHLRPDEIEALVMHGDPLSDDSRRHLASCPACAGLVEREARLELAIYDGAAALRDERGAGAGAAPAPAASGAARGSLVWTYALSAIAIIMLGVAALLLMRQERYVRPPTTAASMDSRGGTRVAPPPLDARFSPDTPCLRDPRTYMPGFDVVPPEPPGLRTTIHAPKP
jgi:hypothetical protein